MKRTVVRKFANIHTLKNIRIPYWNKTTYVIHFWCQNSHNFDIYIALPYLLVDSYTTIPSFNACYRPFLLKSNSGLARFYFYLLQNIVVLTTLFETCFTSVQKCLYRADCGLDFTFLDSKGYDYVLKR
jgi:hypothetical protein